MRKDKKGGVIYILTNPSFPDYVKIGYANDIQKRLKQLNRSETIPYAFRVYAVYQVENSFTDKEVHKLIDRLNPELRTIENFDGKERVKEFYAMSADDAYSLLESIAKVSGTESRLHRLTPEGHEILDEQTANEVREAARRGPFRFSDCNIPIGSEIEFVDNPHIKAIVVDDRRIEYNGETTSVSALAKRLKHLDRQVQGTLYFSYKGKRLANIRDEIEGNKQCQKSRNDRHS